MGRSYEHDAVYKSTVRDQNTVKKKKDGTLAVVLTLKLEGKLKNKYDPSKGMEVLPEDKQVGKEVWLNLSGSTLEKSFTYLRSMGFESHQVNRLKPDHPQFHSLLGKEVYLKCAYSDDKFNPGTEKEWWNIITFDKVKTSEDFVKEVNDKFAEDEEFLKAAYESSLEPMEAF